MAKSSVAAHERISDQSYVIQRPPAPLQDRLIRPVISRVYSRAADFLHFEKSRVSCLGIIEASSD
jgi:hypothetical protein